LRPSETRNQLWLNETILTLPKGMSQRYQEMAVRGQYFARLAERLNLTPSEMDQYLIRNAVKEVQRPDLFSMAA
jgi:DNA sulfur modification protein DndC